MRALRETRDVFVTDGPFVRVTDARGRSVIGRTVRAPARLTVTVTSPAWSAADTLEAVAPDGQRTPLRVTVERSPERVRLRATLEVTRPARSQASPRFVLVRASGPTPIPVLVGDPPLRPLAITNPVWIE